MFNEKNRVVVIGIDGATFEVINPLVDTGRLPNISRIMKKGIRARLKSTIPPISATAWTSFATGMNPGKHGVYDFINKVPNEYRFSVVSARDRKTAPLWVTLSEAGKRVSVIGCTLTYPPDEVNGYMVSGLGTPNKMGYPKRSDYTHPKALTGEIERKIGRYRVTPFVSAENLSDDLKGEIYAVLEYKVRLNRYFFENYLSDFNMYFFGETDIASHLFWDDKDFICRVYEEIDRFIGEVLTRKDVNIILLSDHGFVKRERMFFVDRWLEAEGFLKVRKGNGFKLLSKLKRFKKDNGDSLSGNVWEYTRAFSGHSTAGSIFINLKGREPSGVVEPRDYERVCNEIIDRLTKLVDPKTGSGIVEKAYRKQQVFAGDSLGNAPDIVVMFKRGYGAGMRSVEDRHLKNGEFIADSIYWTGDHEMYGIFSAYGPGFNEGMELEEAEIIDLAPTIIYLFGLPVYKGMDGKVLTSIFRSDFVEANPVVLSADDSRTISYRQGQDLTEEEKQMIARNLKALGYID